ncbi:MAG TPA: hypothetical protein VF980_01975 [Thermoanaerobaculia bacterium]
MRPIILAVAILSMLLLAASATPPALLRSDAPALEVEIHIWPVTQDPLQLLTRVTPGMYRCSVLVHDEPGSNRTWKTKDVVISPGHSGEETATAGELQLHFKATVDRAAEKANAVATVTRNGRVVSRQKTSVFLSRARERG